MELAIKTIATLIMLLVVLLVVGMYFTQGSKIIYDRAGEFEGDTTEHSGSAAETLKRLVSSAWYDCPSVPYPPTSTQCKDIVECKEQSIGEDKCGCWPVEPNKWVRVLSSDGVTACAGMQTQYETEAACRAVIPAGCTCGVVNECIIKT